MHPLVAVFALIAVLAAGTFVGAVAASEDTEAEDRADRIVELEDELDASRKKAASLEKELSAATTTTTTSTTTTTTTTTVPPTTTTAAPPPPPPPPSAAPAAPPPPPPAPSPNVYYRNCTEARAAGPTPIYRGEPGYAPHLDRDNDGIACE